MPNIISKLYHCSAYTEFNAVMHFVLFFLLFCAVPLMIPQVLQIHVLYQAGCAAGLLWLLYIQTSAAAIGPDAQWLELALKNCRPRASRISSSSSASTSKSKSETDEDEDMDEDEDEDEDEEKRNMVENKNNNEYEDHNDEQQVLFNRSYYKMSAVITGVTVGSIGFYTAKYLAALGFRVIMVVRNEEKGEDARLKILEDDFYADLHVVVGDVSDLKGIENDLIEDIRNASGGTWLALLVNNAGIVSDDNELTMRTNYLGSYLLAELLLPTMLKFWEDEADTNNKNSNNNNDDDNDGKKKKRNDKKKWICSKCQRQKSDIAEKNEQKEFLYSECHYCAIKTKFNGTTNESGAIGKGICGGFHYTNIFDGDNVSDRKKEQTLSRLKTLKTNVGYPRVVNVSSFFHIGAVEAPDSKLLDQACLSSSKNNDTTNEIVKDMKTVIEKRLFLATSTLKNGSGAYATSKLCNLMHAMNLGRRFAKSRGVVALSLHPGMVRTNIWSGVMNKGSLTRRFLEKMFFKPAENGAQTSLQCCTQKIRRISDVFDEKSMNGRYFVDCQECPLTVDSPAVSLKELDALEKWTRQQLKEYL